MQQMTIEEMIEVLKAFKEGKKIEARSCESCDWVEVRDPSWNFLHHNYRVKPEPRELWIVFDKGTNFYKAYVYEQEQKLTEGSSRDQIRVLEQL